MLRVVGAVDRLTVELLVERGVEQERVEAFPRRRACVAALNMLRSISGTLSVAQVVGCRCGMNRSSWNNLPDVPGSCRFAAHQGLDIE